MLPSVLWYQPDETTVMKVEMLDDDARLYHCQAAIE